MKLLCETDKTLIEPINYTEVSTLEDPEKLSKDMQTFMVLNNGLGLAAPQIGLPYRMFVMGEPGSFKTVFNPIIVSQAEEKQKSEEGCLTFPGLFIKIPRATHIDVEYENEFGKAVEEKFSGLWAKCFLHEYDHLNGILFTERAGKASLSLARTRRKKYLKRMNANV